MPSSSGHGTGAEADKNERVLRVYERLAARYDRFRFRNGRAVEEVITFDAQPLREALAARQHGTGS